MQYIFIIEYLENTQKYKEENKSQLYPTIQGYHRYHSDFVFLYQGLTDEGNGEILVKRTNFKLEDE